MDLTPTSLAHLTSLIPSVISSFLRSERPSVTSKHVRWALAHEVGLDVRSFDRGEWKGVLREKTIEFLRSHPEQILAEEPAGGETVVVDSSKRRTIAQLDVLAAQGSTTLPTPSANPPPPPVQHPSSSKRAAREAQEREDEAFVDQSMAVESSRPSSKSKGERRPPPAQQTSSSSHAKSRSKRRSSVSSSEEEENDHDHDESDDEGAEGAGEKEGSEDEYRASGSESEDNKASSSEEDDDDDEDGGYRERKRRRTSGSSGRGKGKSKLTGSEAKALKRVEELKQVYKALGHARTRWDRRFREYEFDYERQVEVITQMCLDEGMTEPLTKSRARKVLAENEKEEADETYRRRSSRRARESTALNSSASSYHGFNTRSAAPSTLSGPGTVSWTNAKVVRKEKWQGGYYAYVEEDWDPAIEGAGVGTGLGTGGSLAASSQPANLRAIQDFLQTQ